MKIVFYDSSFFTFHLFGHLHDVSDNQYHDKNDDDGKENAHPFEPFQQAFDLAICIDSKLLKAVEGSRRGDKHIVEPSYKWNVRDEIRRNDIIYY